MIWATRDICTLMENATQNLGEPHFSPAPHEGYPTVLKTSPSTSVETVLPC